MKKFLKNNIVLIAVLAVFLGFAVNAIYINTYEYNLRATAYQKSLDSCEEGYVETNEYAIKFYTEETYKEYCDNLIKQGPPKVERYDAFFNFFDMIVGNDVTQYLQLLGPFLIMICAIWKFLKELKSGYLKNIVTRIDYRKYIKKHWLKSLRCTLIIPAFLIFLFICSLIMSKSLDYQFSLSENSGGGVWVERIFFENVPLNSFVYLLNFILQAIFWINLAYIVARDSKNMILSLITTFLVYMGLWYFFEVFIGFCVGRTVLHMENLYSYFSFTTIWSWELIDNLLLFTLIQFAFAFISTLVLIVFYNNKEKVIMNNEK